MKTRKLISLVLILLFIDNAYSTEGQMSNEFTNYTYVGGGDYVNKFTGQFNYSIPIITIPGPGGSGYEMALSYNSGSVPDTESSWVGFGWQLSPGAINRQVNGIPDDFNNIQIKNYQKFRKVYNVSRTVDFNAEYRSYDETKPSNDKEKIKFAKSSKTELKLSQNLSVNYSNVNNFSTNYGFNLSEGFIKKKGLFSLGGNFSNSGDISLNIGVNWTKYILPEFTNNEDTKFWGKTLTKLINNSITGGVNFSAQIKQNASFPNLNSEYEVITKYMTFKPNLAYSKFKTEGGIPSSRVTEQKPIDNQPLKKQSFGEMYHGYNNNKEAISDFYLENDYNFNINDKYLPIPFKSTDKYIVSVQGLGGVFKVYSSEVGSKFRKNSIKNKSKTIGGGLAFGYDITLGFFNIGGDYYQGGTTESINPSKYSNTNLIYGHDKSHYETSSHREILPSIYFKFINDLGSDRTFYENENLFKLTGYTDYTDYQLKNNKISDKNDFIPMSKNIEFFRSKDINTKRTKYFHRSIYDNLKDYKDINDYMLMAFIIDNEDGKRYEFGQPIFTRNNVNMSYGISKLRNSGYVSNSIFSHTKDNYRVYHSINPKHDKNKGNEEPHIMMGRIINEPYVTSYLLTNIYSNDYVDLNNDGPSIDDIGTYTEFKYYQTAGDKNKKYNIDIDWKNNYDNSNTFTNWFKFRTPYNGFNYSKGSYSDVRDDMISYNSGEKELFYLNTIATKTHIAVFVTNQSSNSFTNAKTDEIFEIKGANENRKDNFEAIYNEYHAGSSSTVTSANSGTINKQKYLERIELWTIDSENPKDENGNYRLVEHLKTVKFEYDYSIWPNQISSLDSVGKRYGKLTLKRIWTEYGNVKEKENSPYVFSYTDNTEQYEIYNGNIIANYNNGITPAKMDEPDYNYLDVNSWGDYEPDNLGGENKKQYYLNSSNQNNSNTFSDSGNHTYDPAAWQLKGITLPSNGIINIDYEQNEYSFVQDKPSMVMAYVKSNGYDKKNGKITLDIKRTLGVDNSSTDMLLLIEKQINSQITNNNYNGIFKSNKFYFKFLYGVLGNANDLKLGESNLEYIDGWAEIEKCEIENNELVLKFKQEDDEFTPRILCGQFFEKQMNLLSYKKSDYDEPNDVTFSSTSYNLNYISESEVEDKASDNLHKAFGFYNGSDNNVCKSIYEEYSFIRIPLPNKITKKGAGIRVKRILFEDNFDKLTKNQSKRIYGKEYVYKNKQNESFGVVNNEPSGLEKENALVNAFIKKSADEEHSGGFSLQSLIYNYKENDIEQFDGILGKSLIGMPSIEYSKIIIKDLLNLSTHSGFEINEHYTSKDFPFYRKLNNNLSTFSSSKIIKDKFELHLQLDNTTNVTAEQGYQFINYGLSGKLKKSSKYGGNYDNDEESWSLGYMQQIEYFDVFDDLNVFKRIPILRSDFKIEKTYPGIEVDLINYSEKYERYGYTLNPDADVEFTWLAITDISSNLLGIPPYSYSKEKMFYKVSNKIIDIPPFVKKISTYVDGVKNVEEMIAFNKFTGNPIVKRVNNKFGNASSSQEMYDIIDIPASYVYNELSQKAMGKIDNINLQATEITNTSHTINRSGLYRRKYKIDNEDIYHLSFEPYAHHDITKRFTKNFVEGTVIRVKPYLSNQFESSSEEFYVVTKQLNDKLILKPYLNEDLGIEDDLPYTDYLVSVDIVKSGFKNLLNLSVGQVIKKSSSSANVLNHINYSDNELDSSKSLKQELVDSLNSKIVWIANNLRHFGGNYDFEFNDLNSLIPPNPNAIPEDIENNSINVLQNYYGSENFTTDETFKVYDDIEQFKELSLNDLYQNNSLRIENIYIPSGPDYHGSGIQGIIDNIFYLKFDLVYQRSVTPTLNPSATFHPITQDIIDIIERAATLNLRSIISQLGIENLSSISKDNENKLRSYINEEIGYNDFLDNEYTTNTKQFRGIDLIDIEYNINGSLVASGSYPNYEGVRVYLENFSLYLKNSGSSVFNFPNNYRIDFDNYIDKIFVYLSKKVGSNWVDAEEAFMIENFIDNKNFLDNYDTLFVNSSNKFTLKYNGYDIVSNTYKIHREEIQDDECRRPFTVAFPRGTGPYNTFNIDVTGTFFPPTGNNTDLNSLNLFKLVNGNIILPTRHFYYEDGGELEDKDLYLGFGENDVWCMNFYENYDDLYSGEDILSVQATELSNTWTKYDLSSNTFLNIENEYLNGSLGRWNVKSNYTNRNNIVKSKDYYDNSNIYDNSSFLEYDKSSQAFVGSEPYFNLTDDYKIKPEFVMFNWSIPHINDEYEWIKDKVNTQIDKNGIVTESVDYLGNMTISHYNELGQVVYECVYCDTNKILFRDFEENDNGIAHTGLSSATITDGVYQTIDEIYLTSSKSYTIEFWYEQNDFIFTPEIRLLDINSHQVLSNDKKVEYMTGNWTLFKLDFSTTYTGSHTFQMKSQNGIVHDRFKIDDLLIKPKDAIVKKYVYNKNNFQLMSELDNEHFASFYKYDYQNRLSEIYKETYKGVKLLKQTAYNQPKELVYDDSEPMGSVINMKNEELNTHTPNMINKNVINGNNFLNQKRRINPNKLPNPRIPESDRGFDNKFDMFDFELDKDGLEYKFFNVPIDSLKEYKNNLIKLDSLRKIRYFTNE